MHDLHLLALTHTVYRCQYGVQYDCENLFLLVQSLSMAWSRPVVSSACLDINPTGSLV